MFKSRVRRVVEDLGRGLVFGSTEAAEHAMSFIREVIEYSEDFKDLKDNLLDSIEAIARARPTSALLTNSFRSILLTLKDLIAEKASLEKAREELMLKVKSIVEDAKRSSDKAAETAAKRLSDRERILTVGFSKTVVKTVEYAVEEGKKVEVVVSESRPKSDGRKTASTLSKMGVNVTLIVDSAIRYLMKDVSKVVVGAEAISANGALINKVGTSIAALAAHEARVRVFVVCSSLKISPETVFGELIEIPRAEPSSLISLESLKDLENVRLEAPLYDVTPPEYIDAIITERGVFAPQAVPLIIREIYGSWPPKVLDVKDLVEDIRRCSSSDTS